jgi:hypothetical protein
MTVFPFLRAARSRIDGETCAVHAAGRKLQSSTRLFALSTP